jgi:phasin family protein
MRHCNKVRRLQAKPIKKATTMSTAKTTTENASSIATNGIYAGAEMLQSTFEKSAKLFERAAEFNKGNVEAYMEAATIAGEGLRTISTEISLYSKKSIEESVAAAKEIMGSKSIHEAMEHQTGFCKMAFGAYVGHLKLLNELIVGTTKDTLAPVQGRYAGLAEIAQTATAA